MENKEYKNNRPSYSRYEKRGRDSDGFERRNKHNKNMILLKSLVIAMFVIFITLICGYFIIKNNRQNISTAKCGEIKNIVIQDEVDEILHNDSAIFILTKQELIKIDDKCFKEISRVKFVN